jgi:hypothetical protein
VVYGFQNYEDVRVDVGASPTDGPVPSEGAFKRFDFSFGTSKFDLTLFVVDEGATMRLVLEYDSGLFNADSIGRHLALLDRFARSAASHGAAK